jgi:hypothetical protein
MGIARDPFGFSVKLRRLSLISLIFLLANGCSRSTSLPVSRVSASPEPRSQCAPLEESPQLEAGEAGIVARSRKLRQTLAATDLTEIDQWWRSRQIEDPHKYLLPPMLAKLSLTPAAQQAPIWELWQAVDRDQPDLYHFRSIYDVRLFFLFRDALPAPVAESYRRMLDNPRIMEWQEGGTENHMAQQFISGLALMDGSGLPVAMPHLMAVSEAWLRAELMKYLTIGQGEFHSSTYYGYTIGALLNLYDFAETPERRELARAALDWLATNMAVRLSWGTAGGVESRGFDRATWNSGLSAVAWIWWGADDAASVDRVTTQMTPNSSRLAILAATSGYRPPAPLRSLAQKTLPLPFQFQASHPQYYSYHQGRRFWETFYATADYTLGTLTAPGRSYDTLGTINAQYATYKLVIRDRAGVQNAVVNLGGTYHNPGATGRSPGDRYLQEKGATLYQLRVTAADQAAGVPERSQLVLPRRYGEPQRLGEWYVWQIEGVWLCARVWGDRIELIPSLPDKLSDYLALAALGQNTAWIVDVAPIADYPTLEALAQALDTTAIDDSRWDSAGVLRYTSLSGDRLTLDYAPTDLLGRATMNGKERQYNEAAVLESPYVNQAFDSGRLAVRVPDFSDWQLQYHTSRPCWALN